MKVVVNRAALLSELAAAEGVTERRTHISILNHVLLRTQGDSLIIEATDTETSFSASITADVTAPGSILLAAKKIREVVASLSEELVTLDKMDAGTMVVSAGESNFKVKTSLDPNDFPTIPTVVGEAVTIPLAALTSALDRTLFAVSVEDSKTAPKGLLLKVADGAFQVVAANGPQLAIVGKELSGGVILALKPLQQIPRCLKAENVEYRCDDAHSLFTSGGRTLICRHIEGRYPEYFRHIQEEDGAVTFTVNRQRLAEAFKRVSLMTGERARLVRLALGGGTLTLSAASDDTGEAVDRIACEHSGDLFIGLNPDYVASMLGASVADGVKLSFQFTSEEGGKLILREPEMVQLVMSRKP